MAFDTFLKMEGLEGEATAKGFEGAIEVQAFSFGASNPVNMAGTGMGSGKVSISSFSIMKKTDKTSPDFFTKCCAGDHYDSATLSLRKAGGEQMIYLEYKMKNVFIESVQWSGSSGGDDVPTESLSLAFEVIEISYKPQDDKGAQAGSVDASWNNRLVASV